MVIEAVNDASAAPWFEPSNLIPGRHLDPDGLGNGLRMISGLLEQASSPSQQQRLAHLHRFSTASFPLHE